MNTGTALQLSHLLIVICVILLQSCATIRSTNTYDIYVNSAPTEAHVEVLDRKNQVVYSTYTPDSITLKSGAAYFKRSEYTFNITKPGYKTVSEKLMFDVDGKYYLNFFTSFLMPITFLVIDPISGAMWMPNKQEVFLNLAPSK